MFANSKSREEMKIQWEFRRGDINLDSSSNDSESSLGIEPDQKRQKPVSGSVGADTDETTTFQEQGKADPANFELGKPKNPKRGRTKRDRSACNEKKRGSQRLAPKGSKTNANENAALDDLGNYMNSLLEELKVTRKNLLSWMRKEVRKLVAEEKKASVSEMKEEPEMQQQNNLEENAKVRYQNLFGKSIQIREQNQTEFEPRNSFSSGNGCPTKWSSRNHINPEMEHNYSQAIVLVASSENDKEERFTVPDKSNVQVQQPKSIVLGIKAQNCNNGFRVKSAGKGKIPATPDNQSQDEWPGSSMELKFPSDSFNQVTSSMYLTLPTVLINPYMENYRPGTNPFSCIQPRMEQNQARTNLERPNQMLGLSSVEFFQPGEKSRNYAQIGLRDVGFFNQNSTTASIMGNGFAVPLQVDNTGFTYPDQFNFENQPRENSNLRMNGGAVRVSGGGYNLPESYITNNFHSHTNHRADGRLMTFQDSFQFPK